MKNKIFILLIFIFTNFSFVAAQTAAQGEELFNNGDYNAAKDVYEALLKRDASALNNYRYARCCFELGEYETSILHFQKAGERYPLKYFYLGENYFQTYRFKEAEAAYNTYLEKLQPGSSNAEKALNGIAKAALAADLMSRTEDIVIIDSIDADKDKLLNFIKLNSETGSLKQEKNGETEKITFTTQRSDRRIFSDTVTGNGNDIFEAIKLLDHWAEATALPAVINTPANENYPFLLLDGVTLYFASDGEKSIGGYDIFITRYSPATQEYVQPENVGMPFNSPSNDYMMIVDEQRNIGWFASDRRQPEGKVMIYKFIPNGIKKVLKTDDYDLLRGRASLLSLHFAGDSLRNAYKMLELPANEKKEEAKQQKIYIIINDTTVYTGLENFRNPTALNLYKEYAILQQNFIKRNGELNSLREKYLIAQDKTLLAEKILQEEVTLNLLEKSISDRLNSCVKEENEFLKK